jgi:hypothetical protein
MLDRIDAYAKEVLGRMYQAILGTPDFTLQDGTTCRVDPYYEPQVNAAGELKCGIDVLMDNGKQLEFTVGHSGWGKSFVAGLANKPPKPGRNR